MAEWWEDESRQRERESWRIKAPWRRKKRQEEEQKGQEEEKKRAFALEKLKIEAQ